MKILLLFTYSGRNLGSGAVALAAIRLIRKVFPGCDICCQTTYPASDILASQELFRFYVAEGVESILPSLMPNCRLNPKERGLTHREFIYYILRNSLLLLVSLVARSKASFILWRSFDRRSFQELVSCDLAIAIPGYYFSDIRGGVRGLVNVFIALYPVILAAIFHRPVVF